MSDPTQFDYGQVFLDDLPYPVLQDVGYQQLALFERKVTFGDFSKDSDDLISSWILTDFSGGGQIDAYNEGTDQGRFWFATCHTRDPNQLTLNREVRSYTVASITNSVPGADLGGFFYATYDANIYKWDEATLAFADTTIDLNTTPVNLPIAFGSGAPGAGTAAVLWYPLGTNGYQTWNGAAVSAVSTAITPVAFAEWDNKLFALSTDGKLSTWDGTAWQHEPDARLDARHTPRSLVAYYDVNSNPVLHAVTNKGIFAYDHIVGKFFPTPAQFPAHPSNGRGAAVWQVGGDMFVTAGAGVYRYAIGSTISAVGLDRDHGLPATYRGDIVDLRAEHNGLYALVKGAVTSAADEPSAVMDPYLNEGDALAVQSAAVASLQYFTNIGWHTAWVADGAVLGEPTRVQVSEAEGAYRLWWGHGGTLHTMLLPTDFHNPRQGILAGVDRFQLSGYLETGWFDAAMLGFTKLASDVVCYLDECSATAPFVVKYKVDDDLDWMTLATFTARGKRVVLWDPNGDGFEEGLAFDRIRFRFEFSTSDATKTALLSGFVFHFCKLPKLAGSWQLTIPLMAEDGYAGRTNAQIKTDLDALLAKRGFVKLTHNHTNYRVRLSQTGGSDKAGNEDRGMRGISVVEIRREVDEVA